MQILTHRSHICHLTSVHFALDTRIFYRFCRSLAADYQVTLIGVHPAEEVVEGIRIIPFRRFRNKLFRVCFTWLLMYLKARKVNADLYQFHDPELIPCGLLLKWTGKKVIFDIHENVAEDIFDKPWIPNKKLLFAFFTYFEKRAVKQFHLFLAENSYEARYKNMQANYTVVLNYYDPGFFNRFASGNNRHSNRIFYIGILLESRGLLQIAEALWILKKKGLHVDFDVVGELYTDLSVKLDTLPFYNEIRGQMHFHGRLPLEQGYAYSRNAAVGMCMIYPMKNSVGSYPTKMFEYMAIGLPQVISHFPLYKSVVETHQCGICADPENPEEIARAIETLLKDRELADRMAANAAAAAPGYTWNTQFEKVIQVYKSLLGV